MSKDYIQYIRSKVGSDTIFLNFSGVWIENENGILLEKRSDNGTWGLIGGCMELGESGEEAAIRECKEETGLEVTLNGFIGVYTKFSVSLSNGHQYQPICLFYNGSVDPKATPKGNRHSTYI